MNPNPAPSGPEPSPRELNKAYSDLLDHLNAAYWSAGTLEGKNQIKSVIDNVTGIIIALDAADLTARDAAYQELSAQVTSVNKRLATLQTQISSIIGKINSGQTVISDISKVLTAAANIFPAI